MTQQGAENRRVRAWLLAEADPPQAVTQLYRRLGHEGGDDYVVVRADIVDYPQKPQNVLIPIDAASENALNRALEDIEALGILEEIEILRVEMHAPLPPHIAHGYITDAELHAQREKGVAFREDIRPGRQGASPGHNAWG